MFRLFSLAHEKKNAATLWAAASENAYVLRLVLYDKLACDGLAVDRYLHHI